MCERGQNEVVLANLVVERDIQRAVQWATTSYRLDLSWMGMTELPLWIVKKLDKLQVLVLAGNKIKSLPDPLAYVTSLRTLLVSGNKLVRDRVLATVAVPWQYPDMVVERTSEQFPTALATW